jgi:hypothetical protein
MAASQDGFELGGEFYPFHVDDTGKNLMLIDRLTGLSLPEFSAYLGDDTDRNRGPVTLALVATSIRAAKPDWSVEKIVRLVQNTRISDIEWVDGEQDAEETDASPPAETPPDEPSSSPANGSSPSSTRPEPSTSWTSFVTPT